MNERNQENKQDGKNRGKGGTSEAKTELDEDEKISSSPSSVGRAEENKSSMEGGGGSLDLGPSSVLS